MNNEKITPVFIADRRMFTTILKQGQVVILHLFDNYGNDDDIKLQECLTKIDALSATFIVKEVQDHGLDAGKAILIDTKNKMHEYWPRMQTIGGYDTGYHAFHVEA